MELVVAVASQDTTINKGTLQNMNGHMGSGKALKPVHGCEAAEVQGRGCHPRGQAKGSECWVHIGQSPPDSAPRPGEELFIQQQRQLTS